MIQDALFHETVNDALRAIIERAGGAKSVGLRLRPSKSADEAGRWLLDCLNPTRRERLDPEDLLHLLKIGRDVGYHGAMGFIANECGYKAEPVDPEDEHAKLQREFIESVKASQRIAARLERLATPTVKAVA